MDGTTVWQSGDGKLKWAEVTPEFVLEVATHLREEDQEEVMLSDQVTGFEACTQSWAMADICNGIATDDGTPVGLCGLNGDRIWLLGTPELTATKKRRLQLCREGRGWVEHCVKSAGRRIGNDVYSKNFESIKWLKALGFTVEEPRPIGHSGALFRAFWREP